MSRVTVAPDASAAITIRAGRAMLCSILADA
jgi:hypothetical protein